MRPNTVGAAAALLASASVATPAFAGAWPAEKGEAKSITTFTYDVADRAFDDDGDAVGETDFEKIEASAFLEYGLTSRLTLVAQPVVQNVRIGDPSTNDSDTEVGFASSQLGLRWLAAQGERSVLAVQGVAVIPGEAENVTNAPFGEGGLAGEARVLVGRDWGGSSRGVFAEAQAGWRWRADEDADEARLDLTLGARPAADWSIIGQSFSTWSMDDDGPGMIPFDSHKAQLSAVRRVSDRVSLQVGGYASYAGRNVIDERAGFVSLWVELN